MNIKRKEINISKGIRLNRIIVLGYVLIIIYPVFFVFLTSLKSTSEFYENIWGLPRKLEWSNYVVSWTQGGIGAAFFESLFIVGTTVFFVLFLGALAGYALARLHFPYANFVLTILLICFMLPTEMVLIPQYLMVTDLGLLGTRLALILSYVGWGLPVAIYIFKGFFITIPNELIEATRIDGAGEFKIFYKVIVPLMLPPIATMAIFTFVSTWGELLWALVILGTQSKIATLPFAVLQFKGKFLTDWGPLSAAICMVTLPLIVFFIYTQKYFVRGLTAGGVKG